MDHVPRLFLKVNDKLISKPPEKQTLKMPKRKREKQKTSNKMATASIMDTEREVFREEIVELLRENRRIDLSKLQGLYQGRFKKDVAIKRFGISSMKQLVVLFGDTLDIFSVGNLQYLIMKPSPPPSKVQKVAEAAKASKSNWDPEFDSNLSEPGSPLSPQMWAATDQSSVTGGDAHGTPQGRLLLTDLKINLLELIQSSPEGQIGLEGLPDAYKKRYRRCLNLEDYGIESLEAVVDKFSDVLEVVSHCSDINHKRVRNKPLTFGAEPNIPSSGKSKREILRQELELLLQSYPKGVALSALSKKYAQKYHNNICKREYIYKEYKDDFDFFSTCRIKTHQFLRLKSGLSLADTGEGSRAEVAMPPPAANTGAGLLGSGPLYYFASAYPDQHPHILKSSPVPSGMFAAPVPLMALHAGMGRVQLSDRPEHLWEGSTQVPTLNQQQPQHTPTETLTEPTELPTSFHQESRQPPGVSFGNVDPEMLQLPSKNSKRKKSKAEQQKQQGLQQLQEEPQKMKTAGKKVGKKSKSKITGASLSAKKDLKTRTASKQQQQQDKQQQLQQQQLHEEQRHKAIQQQQQDKQQQLQQQQLHEEQRHKAIQQQQRLQLRQSSSSSQLDPKLSKVDAVAQTIIANIAEANELVTMDRVVDLLKQHFQVPNLKTIGVHRPNQLPALTQLNRLQSKVNAFIQAFVKVRAIGTLHELRESLAMVNAPPGYKEKLDYAGLQLGPLAKQPLVWEFFKFPPTKEDKDIPEITTPDILEVLDKYLTDKDLWRSKVDVEKFTEYLMEVYDIENPYDLGLRIQSIGLGISAIKTAKREQKISMDRAREILRTSLANEVTATTEKIRKAVMSPADIVGHPFAQLELRRRYVDMSATQAMNRICNNAGELMAYSRHVRQFCTALRQVAGDPLSRSLVQLAISIGDLSRPTDLPTGLLESDDEPEEEEDSRRDETSPAKSQPSEDKVKEELLCYLNRLQHGSLNLEHLARIETKLCQHFGFPDFPSLSRSRTTFLRFLSMDCAKVLESLGGALMSLVSSSPDQGSVYRPSRMDLVEFIQQCNPHKESLEATDICLCSHYQVNCVEELGHGPLQRLSQPILKMGSRGYQQEQNAVLYEAALCAPNRQNTSKQKKVGLFGSQSLESALGCLASAPLLEDLSEWSHWLMVFEPEHGNLKTFLERGRDIVPPIEISALEVRPGVLLRLATETTPDLFAAAAKGGDSVTTVGQLVSLVAKDGLHSAPLALLSNHMETALNVLAADSDQAGGRHDGMIRFVLDCLVAIPELIGQAVVRQVILKPLTAVLGSEVKSRQLILKACRGTGQKTKLQRLGLLLGIGEWKDSFTEDRMPRDQGLVEDDLTADDDDEFDFDNLEFETQKPLKPQAANLEDEDNPASTEADPRDSSISPPLQEAEPSEELELLPQDEQEEDIEKAEDVIIIDDDEEMDIKEDESEREEVEIVSSDENLDAEASSLSAPPLPEESADAGVNEPTPAPVLPELTPAPVLPELTPAPVLPELTPAPVLPEPTPAPVLPEPTPAPALPELTPFQQSVLDCKGVVQHIRQEEFGVGVALDETAQRLMVRHQDRIGRSLKRLSEELYSKDTHFVLELIQNADDNDYQEGVEPALVFVVDRSEVVVLNNEQGFSESNIRALCDIGRSTKGKHKRGYIGHKGIGFKSVFRVTDKPEITSNGYHVCFDRSADQMGYILPTWVGPEDVLDIAKMDEPQKPWTTKIRLPLKGDFQRTSSLVNKFEDIQPSLLLFLNRLKTVRIKNKEENTTSHMSRRDKGGNVIEIRHNKSTTSWLLIKKCLDATKLQRLQVESTELGLAFPLTDGKSSEQNVFAFLPLRSYGFHFIIQGDFDIPSSREDVDADSAWNQWLVQEIAPLFIEALEYFKTHFSDDPIKAVCQFLKFVPLDSQILTDFFCKVAVSIHKRLKASPCMPVLIGDGEDEVAWKLPSETIMCQDPLVREIVPSPVLSAHLSCSYLHQRVVGSVSEALLKSLGVKVLQTSELLNIFSSVASAARQSGIPLVPSAVAQWLTCVYCSRKREYDVSQDALDRLRRLPIIPLSSGWVVAMEEGTVFFPISAEDTTGQSQGRIQSASSKPLQALEEDMSTLDIQVLTSLDSVANSQIVQLLEDLGVRHISPRDVIRHHILPVIQGDQWQEKPREVLVGYAVYIKEHLERQPDVCDLKEVADHLHVLTNHGLVQPRQRPVHFTVAYGNKLDLNAALPGYDWVLLDSCYIYHQGSRRLMPDDVQRWNAFFMKLGVLNYLAVESTVLTVKEEELDVTPWADLSKHWPKPADGVYKIQDYACKEFEELVQADLEVSTMQSQRQSLLGLLQKEWRINYMSYKGASVCDQSGTKIADTYSSFAINLKTRSWLPSTPVSGENNVPVVFRSPAEVFVSTDETRRLLSDHVPYLTNVQGDGSGLLQFIGVKTAEVINASFMISKLKTWCSDDEDSLDLKGRSHFCTSLAHIFQVYKYLEQQCPPQELRELFGDHRVVFVPKEGCPANIGSPVQGQFVHKSLVYWQDPSNLLQKYDGLFDRDQLCGFYPRYMEDFFLRQINVDVMPTIKEYASLLVHCAGDVTLPDNTRIKEEILVLYSLLGQKCVSSSAGRSSQHFNLSAAGAAQQKLEVDQGSAQFVKKVLDDQPIFPTLRNKWVMMTDRPLICDSHSGDLQKLFADKKEVHLLNFGDRDRLGRVVEASSGSVNKQFVDIFLDACGVEKLSECIREEFITELTKPSLPLQLFLHEVCPYVQLNFVTHQNANPEFQSAYKKLTAEVNIAAKLKVMRFMAASKIEKLYYVKHDRNVFAKQRVDCGLQDLTEFYIASSISESLRESSDVRREVAKLFSGGSLEVQRALFNFLGSLLLELKSRKSPAGDQGMNESICKALDLTFPPESKEELWEVPKPFIPEEVVVKPVKVVALPDQMPQPPTGAPLLDDGDDARTFCWPPKSSAYGPQKAARGGQASNEDAVLKKWPSPQPPVSDPPFPSPQPPGLHQQPTHRQQQPGDADSQEAAGTDAGRVSRHHHQASQGDVGGALASGSVDDRDHAHPTQANRQGALPRPHQASEGGLPHPGPSRMQGGDPGMAVGIPREMGETLDEAEVRRPHQGEPQDLPEDPGELTEDPGEVPDDSSASSHLGGDILSQEPIQGELYTPPQVQRTASLSHFSSSGVKKFFVPPLADDRAIEVEFEDLPFSPGLLGSLTEDDLPLAQAENLDTTDIARWGEKLVYLYLANEMPPESEMKVHWVNQEAETGEPYDIVITCGSASIYIEVKSTIKDQKQVVEISPREVAFAQEKRQFFHLYRVFNAGNTTGVRLCRLRDLALRMDRKEVKLFMYL